VAVFRISHEQLLEPAPGQTTTAGRRRSLRHGWAIWSWRVSQDRSTG